MIPFTTFAIVSATILQVFHDRRSESIFVIAGITKKAADRPAIPRFPLDKPGKIPYD